MRKKPENQRDFFSESTFDDEGGSQSATFESSKVFSGEKDTECQVFQNRTQVNNIVLKIAYEGTDFYGWQCTRSGPTIESKLKYALEHLLNEPIMLQAASRTDRGVHAEGQIVNFLSEQSIDLWKLTGGLNALLPSSIRVLKIWEESLSFHPSLDAKRKEYHYMVCQGGMQLPQFRNYSWHVPYDLNEDEIQQAISYLVGEQDFTSFCNIHSVRRQTVCCVESIQLIPCRPHRLCFVIRGNRFLYKMIRNLVGTLIYVGRGKIAAKEIPGILEQKSRPLAGVTAPAKGLTLKEIYF